MELLDIDTPDLPEEIEAIAKKDEAILLELTKAMHEFNWQEKMAVATNATVVLNRTHTQLCFVSPTHHAYSAPLNTAITLLRHLSPQALCELAVDLLLNDWGLGAVADFAPSTLIE